ncbi:MAG: hypothetical protein OXU73_02865 [Candidatus Campbellbacteria bacterium]|nr:hypothetical protein [Candidatus Campbellbacteria bacterium]
MSYQEIAQSFGESFSDVWGYVLSYVPSIIAAIIIFFIGWVIAIFVRKYVAHGINAIPGVSSAAETIFGEALRRAGMRLDIGKFIGVLVQLFIVVVFLVVALDVLNLDAITQFFTQILAYIPSVIIAAVILVGGAFIADIVERVVVGATKATRLRAAQFAGTISKWAIWIFSIFIALDQLGVSLTFITPLFQGVILALAIALGLSFGFGGKDLAEKWLQKFFSDSDR